MYSFIIACIFQLTVDSLSFFIRIVIYVEDYIGEVSDDDVVKRVIDVACEKFIAIYGIIIALMYYI